MNPAKEPLGNSKNKFFFNNLIKASKVIINNSPIILGVLLLSSLISSLKIGLKTTGIKLLDAVIGALIGGLAIGNPTNSYIIAGESIKLGVSIAAITAFLISWVVVGITTIPLEAKFLGKRFALYRNIISLTMSIISGLIIGLLV